MYNIRTMNYKNQVYLSWIILAIPGLIYLALGLSSEFCEAMDFRTWKTVLKHTGYIALGLFAGLLSLNPLIKLFPNFSPLRFLNRFRRPVGVASFAYVCLHVLAVIVYKIHKKGFFPFEKLILHPVLLPGTLAFAVLLLLALTSNATSLRYLGSRRWKRLHRWAYFAQFLILAHLALQGGQVALIGLATLIPLSFIQYLYRFLNRDRYSRS